MVFRSVSFAQPGVYLGAELCTHVRAVDGWTIESGKEGWVFCTPPNQGDTFCIPREKVTNATIERRGKKARLRAA